MSLLVIFLFRNEGADYYVVDLSARCIVLICNYSGEDFRKTIISVIIDIVNARIECSWQIVKVDYFGVVLEACSSLTVVLHFDLYGFYILYCLVCLPRF